jgi:PKD repeat protein
MTEASCSNSKDGSITLNNSSSNPSTVQLKDAAGNFIKEAQVLGAYTFDKLAVGNYQISYPNASACGNMNQTITVTAAKDIIANFDVTSDNLMTEQVVTFTAPVDKNSNLNWNFGDGTQVNGSFSVTHKYAQEGEYMVTLINTKGECTSEKSVLLNVKQAISSEAEMDVQMINGQFYALFNFKDNTLANIMITNTLGQQINITQTFEGKKGQVKLDLTGNADGIYLINLNDGKNNFTKKIVK